MPSDVQIAVRLVTAPWAELLQTGIQAQAKSCTTSATATANMPCRADRRTLSGNNAMPL